MQARNFISLILIVFTVMTLATGIVRLQNPPSVPRDSAWEQMPRRDAHVDHSHYFSDPFEDGPAVTRACLECHDQQAHEFMATAHWNWTGHEVRVPGHDGLQVIGKKNLINNFCISVQSNWPKCTSCHAGYGWQDESFDFTDAAKIDCLICHDDSGQYAKGDAGYPTAEVDLLAAARSVALPDRTNCGVCHFNGGGGNAVKHGDLDQTMYFPTRDVDVHMGGSDFTCIDCHTNTGHQPGTSDPESPAHPGGAGKAACTNCHSDAPHANERLNAHVQTVACQTCHIPAFATREATKMYWDWSEAGQDLPVADPHEYLKIKGRFKYARSVEPEYAWFNGETGRYLKGDAMDPEVVTDINKPQGHIADPEARIWPFKIHRGKQIYDTEFKTLLIPQTVGEGAYWDAFDWDAALRMAEPHTGLPYSGSYGFAETAMYWPLSHMVAPAERSLQCVDCHGPGGRMDWAALGYPGDPERWGGRDQLPRLRGDNAGSTGQ